MTLAPRQSQRQHQTLSFRQLQAISILRLDNAALTEFLLRKAEANPMMRVVRAGGSQSDVTWPELADRATGLHDHVLPQLPLILSSDEDRSLGLAFLEALAPTGWLEVPLARIAADTGQPVERVAAVLATLQAGIDPAGLFARDLRECLWLQAVERDQLDHAMAQVLDHLQSLGSAGVAAVAAQCGLDVADVSRCLSVIRRMDPRPGLAFSGDQPPLREPDVIVARRAGDWTVELNRATLAAVTLAPDLGTVAGPALQAARTEVLWLAQIVERRNSTVLSVARAVLSRQQMFLDQGPRALVALSRVEIARTLGLHDSTVGRIAHELLVQTPHGMRTLGSLFGGTSHATLLHHGSSAAPSSAAIRLRLSELIAAEDPFHPLSDARLGQALAQEGKPVARRTIARFRQLLGIPGCSDRRRASAKPNDAKHKEMKDGKGNSQHDTRPQRGRIR